MTPDEPGAHPADRILRRMDSIESDFEELCRLRKWAGRGVYLNLDLLYHAIDSYFQDVDRMKDYRFIKHLDRHKQAAFTMKWIAALRPIQIEKEFIGQAGADSADSLLLANECLALHSGLSYMAVQVKMIPGDYLRNFLYILHFHPVSPEQLASEMFLLESLCGGFRS